MLENITNNNEINTSKHIINIAKSLLPGIILTAIITCISLILSEIPQIKQLGISPLIIGILLGMLITNTIKNKLPVSINPGITFSAKKILRLAIILYGFRLSFQQIASVGFDGFIISLIMLSSTFILGIVLGQKLFKLDRDTSILIASGSSICGAAAVMATESVLKSDSYKNAIAVGTVVIFGTLSMFLYPVMYQLGLIPLSSSGYGIYAGATIHEVAQVVGAGSAVDTAAANTAVIVKMTRVMMLAPLLIIVGIILSKKETLKANTNINTTQAKSSWLKIIPLFAIGFIIIAAVNSLHIIDPSIVGHINNLDTFLLTIAMTALGLETHISKFRQAGLKPIILAFILFIWLIFGGLGITWLIY
ncbi:MAG: YeiH family putative sulfate export transporter [Gammaproteobacteria bacterium]|nr:MAG: YeiH family putative sulfate export transporter [Gammaproteobacteria bacterium]UTW42334.1 YeiH family putative sulfate export transporter [bacterium SCSIO 12844]